jgi:protein SPT2
MPGFAALMALSASQTKESQSAVQVALAQRQRKEEARRKQQEEQERKERELEHKLRIKHFEDEKKAQERRLQQEHEEKAREAALQRRAEEQRDALRYGPKKARASASSGDSSPRWPSSATQGKSDVRRRRFPSDDDDADSSGGSPGAALTREEKRERKLQAELNRTFHSAKRTSHANGYAKAGKMLPGGACDVTTTPGLVDSGSSSQSVKARIAAMPNTLTKLNVVKRDTRTIDEILQDRAKARDVKVLDGDEAREFNDWFGKGKKKDPAKKSSQPLTPSPTSGANTPVSRVSSPCGYLVFLCSPCILTFTF